MKFLQALFSVTMVVWPSLLFATGTPTGTPNSTYSGSDDFAHKILSNVVSASRYYSFTGLLTYEANGSLNTLRLRQNIVGTKNEGYRVYQELEFLDGLSRRVVRDQSLALCDKGQTRWGLWPDRFDIKQLLQQYNVVVYGKERVANRDTVLVGLVPKDQLRYQHQFNVDQKTGLILRAAVLEKETLVERTQFLQIDFINTDGESALKGQKSMLWRVPEIDPCHQEQFTSPWVVTWLPEGFVSAGNRVTSLGEQTLIFTDGLVSISVFITENQQELSKLTARRGATIAVITPMEADQSKSVAVVGEVPVATARRIAVSVKPE